MTGRLHLPRLSFHHAAHQLAVAVIAVSVVQGLLIQAGYTSLLFIPLRVLWGLEVWRPFTSLLVGGNPLEIIFGALIIYSIGGTLEGWWGRKRFLLVSLGIPLAGQLVTLVATLLAPGLFTLTAYASASSILTAIWITFGLNAWFSRTPLSFWGTPITGKTFALIGLGFVVLGGVFNGFLVVLPELVTAGLCYAYMYQRGSFDIVRRIELWYYNWKLRRLKARRGLHIVKSSRPADVDDEDQSSPHIH
jgi:membrane associated rhomboid family serine protease